MAKEPKDKVNQEPKTGKAAKAKKDRKAGKTKQPVYAELHDRGAINARIIDAKSGLKVIGGVYAIRIHSKGFYALIMNDYMPTMGKIEGSISFLNKKGEQTYDGVKGFYKHQHNEFTLLIEEHEADQAREGAAGQ